MSGEKTKTTVEETSTTDLNQSLVRNVSINHLSNNLQVKIQSNTSLPTTDDIHSDTSIDDLINSTLCQEIDHIRCDSAASNYTICSETTPVLSTVELDAETPAYSQSENDLTSARKRKRLFSPNKSETKEFTIRAELRVLRKIKKRVSFVLQDADQAPTPTPIVPPPANASITSVSSAAVSMDQSDSSDDEPDATEQALRDARGYLVPGDLVNLWKLLLNAMKNIARAHARIHGIDESLEAGAVPLWCYGLALPPPWLQPFKAPQVREAHEAALAMAQTTKAELRVEMASSQREARELREALQRMYRHADNPDSNLAIQRASGIASHFRAKEISHQVRQRAEDDKSRPTTDTDWNAALSRRQAGRSSSPKKGQSNNTAGKGNKKAAKPTSSTNTVVDNERPSTSSSSGYKSTKKEKKGKKRPRSPAPTPSSSATSAGSSHTAKQNKNKPAKKNKSEDKGLTEEEAAMLKILRAALSKNKK